MDWYLKSYEALYSRLLRDREFHDWEPQLRKAIEQSILGLNNGNVPRWERAVLSLPEIESPIVSGETGVLTIDVDDPSARPDSGELTATLRQLCPWRKGPFSFFGTPIDTEWRSDWKWRRVAPHLESLLGRRVLDLGCGNGYYGWRMAEAGAQFVIGVDPHMLFGMQFQAVHRYAGAKFPSYVVPLRIEDLPPHEGRFDTVFSMGVLYHRKSPIEHLLELAFWLRPGGELVLETLVVEGPEGYSLVPEDRYSKMRNVWFIPSPRTLESWLRRCGFSKVRTVDVTRTTVDEQRGTAWMGFESLPDFLDPNDPTKTIEGLPAPTRAIIIAEK